MSKENLVNLLAAAATDEQLGQQLQSADSFEAVKNLAAEQGFDLSNLSPEEAQRTINVVTGAVTEELSDEELEMVAGGWSWGKIPGNVSKGSHDKWIDVLSIDWG